jgi:hypothetical protein
MNTSISSEGRELDEMREFFMKHFSGLHELSLNEKSWNLFQDIEEKGGGRRIRKILFIIEGGDGTILTMNFLL